MNQHSRLLLAAAAVLVAIGVGGCSKRPEASAAKPAASSAPANVSDIDVTEHVKTALHQAELLKGADITVVTLKGDVRLIGVLDSSGPDRRRDQDRTSRRGRPHDPRRTHAQEVG